MMKVVVELDVNDDKSKKEAMRIVSNISGVTSFSMDMKDKKLTVTGDMDPVEIVTRLRKFRRTDILLVVPEKEPGKKEEPKKEDENWNSLPSTSTRSLEEMKEVVAKLAINSEKSKKKAMTIVSSISGVNSVSMDVTKQKLTVTGHVNPADVVLKLRAKLCLTELLSVGPEKRKKGEPKKGEDDEEPKDPENREEQPKKREEPKKDGIKEKSKKPGVKGTVCRFNQRLKTCHAYNPQYLRNLLNVIQLFHR